LTVDVLAIVLFPVKERVPEPVLVRPLLMVSVPASVRVEEPVLTVELAVTFRARLALVEKVVLGASVPPLRVRVPAVAPRLASAPKLRVPALREVPPE
jgi:hypothetical protein